MCSEIQKSLDFEPGVWLSMNVIILETTRTKCFLLNKVNSTITVAIQNSELWTILVLHYVYVVIDLKTLRCLERRGKKGNRVNMNIMED